jgi:hypothetical protein
MLYILKLNVKFTAPSNKQEESQDGAFPFDDEPEPSIISNNEAEPFSAKGEEKIITSSSN